MIILRKKTLTQAWNDACAEMFFGEVGDKRLDLQKGSSMTMTFTNMLIADSLEFKMDVWENLHLTKSRFPVLQRTYVNPQEFADFMVRCQRVYKQRGAVTKLHANPHKPRGINRTKVTGNYAHGGCIHGWDFRVDKSTKRPQLIMHSRVSYLPYMGALDLALSYCIAKEIGNELGFAVEECGLVWYCTSFQYAHMQSAAYTWNRDDFMEAIDMPKTYPDSQYPTIKLMRNTLGSFREKMDRGFAPEDEKFAQLMRYRRRWEARVTGDDNGGRWKSIPLSQLNLDAIKSNVPVALDEEDDDE